MSALAYPIGFLLCHFIGDFALQSDWMAMKKNTTSWNCFVHVLFYTACFLALTTSIPALLFIGITHFILDRNPILIKRAMWWKNHFPTGYVPWRLCSTTGYYDDSPYNEYKPRNEKITKRLEKKYGRPRHFFITVWIYIVIDNSLHLLCNLIALTLLAGL